jgi:AhpD family alkylhydroperoxidase
MNRPLPLATKQWPPEMRAAIAAMNPPDARYSVAASPDRPAAMATLGTLAHHPALAAAFGAFNGHVLRATTLTERHRELIVLRVAAVRQCSFEWTQHVFLALEAGIDHEEIGRVAYGPNAPFWSAFEATLLRSVDELLNDGIMTDDTWNALAEEFSTQQLLDLMFTVGAYFTVALMMRCFDLQLDDNTAELLDNTRNRRAAE